MPEERIGVFVCECGPNIADNVDIDRLLEMASSRNGVIVAEKHKLLCSAEGQEFLEAKIAEYNLTRLVVAACSPKQHEPTFMGVCGRAELNPYFFQMANIREQCAWVIDDKSEATDKALHLLSGAIARVVYHTPLRSQEIACNPDALVIGGGVTGMQTAILLASTDREVYLIERSASLGGAVAEYEKLFPTLASGPEFVQKMETLVRSNPRIHVLTSSEPGDVVGFFGNFIVTVHRKDDETEMVQVGAVVIATGFEYSDVEALERYGYGKHPDILTALDFERLNAGGKIALKDGTTPRSVGIVHCVGRDERGYCSAACCLYALKCAHYLSEKVPGSTVVEFYRDLCLPARKHTAIDLAEKGVEFVQCGAMRIETEEEHPRIVCTEGEEMSRSFDMIILAPPMVAVKDSERIAEMLNLSLDEKGFFIEEHEKLAPVSTTIEGVYIAGCAQGPKGVSDSITQAEAVAGRILSSLVPGRKLETEAKTSVISESLCRGCKTCLEVCTYKAISFDELRHVCVVNEVLCKGCGNCAAACPSGAAQVKHYTRRQLAREVAEVLR